MDIANVGIRCDRCHEPMTRIEYVSLQGECDECMRAHLDSFETDGLGMGDWNHDE